MAEKMLELLQDENLRESVGRQCRQRAEGFRPDVIFEQWRSYVEKIAYQ
jgi:glycosyltransferase involved in cell wall biosynthesis